MFKTLPLLLSLALLFSGCALLVPEKKYQFAPTNLQQATIYVFHDRPETVGSSDVVVANGSPIARLSRRQYTWFYVNPGTLDLRIVDRSHPDRVLASGYLPVVAGRSYYIRFREVRGVREEVLMGDGLAKDVTMTAITYQRGDIIEIPESDGIAMTTTHERVRAYPQTATVRTLTRVVTYE